ncbi:type II toxin-antitoxin system RelE/ParE family toxin [Breoghania sp. JC706]|uniref:type II toxin-antitoxin system RelE/ParE family toxin n=1 Tax=Breoghania sp. JC706 TaxID=3117732 RepID=UPI00300A8E2E
MPASLPGVRLTPRAQDDLEEIWRYTARTWSERQADDHIDELMRVFAAIAAMPAMAPRYDEFRPPVRIHVHGTQLIVYDDADGSISVVRVLGARQDWRSVLASVKP